jgi:single-strand DNA-binding protein
MASLNKVILIGHLVADPELRQTPTNASVVTFQIGVTRRFARAGEQNKSDFFTIVAWNKTADFICNYFKKGNAICVCGSLQTRTWTAQDGSKRYAVEVLADEANFVEKKSENARTDSDFDMPAGEAPEFEDVTRDSDLPF